MKQQQQKKKKRKKSKAKYDNKIRFLKIIKIKMKKKNMIKMVNKMTLIDVEGSRTRVGATTRSRFHRSWIQRGW